VHIVKKKPTKTSLDRPCLWVCLKENQPAIIPTKQFHVEKRDSAVTQGQAGWGSEQPGLVKDVPAHCRGIGLNGL